MISLLARFFCKSDGKSPAQLRTAYGILCGAVGIGLNLLLFLGKFFAGTLSGSVAITADAFNTSLMPVPLWSRCWASALPPKRRTQAIPSATAGRSTSPVWRYPC